MTSRRASILGVLAALAAAAGLVAFAANERGWVMRLPTYDGYSQFFPNVVYALRSLAAGGAGLLWNPLQNCGQPFFGIGLAGLLYPPYLIFLVLPPHTAWQTVIAVNLFLTGLGTYLLCRVLGAGRLAALAGALVFEAGNESLRLALWTPIHASALTWLPWALWACERTLRRPTLARAAALGGVLALALLPGFPQLVFFAYQLVALRLLWELATRWRGRASWTAAGAVVLGLVLAPLLAAAQFVPALEVATRSVRPDALTVADLVIVRDSVLSLLVRRSTAVPLLVAPMVLVWSALLERRTRRAAAFYALAAVLYAGLALGPGWPPFDLYAALPLGMLFRDPLRFFWAAGVCIAPVVALGIEALGRPTAVPRVRLAGCGAMVIGALALAMLVGGLAADEWAVAAIVVVAAFAVAVVPRRGRLAAAAAALAVVAGLWLSPRTALQGMFPDAARLWTHAEAFAALRARMSPQERVHLVGPHPQRTGFAFMPKSATLFDVPSTHDYEPLTTQRWAEYLVRMRKGVPMRSVADFNLAFAWVTPSMSRQLLDRTAARWVLAEPSADTVAEHLHLEPADPPLPGRLRLYENPSAVPRARWVPAARVQPNASALLDELALGDVDASRLVLLEEPPPSHDPGGPGRAGGAVRFVENHPERLVLEVDAPRRGFLVLADQWFPGWRASVDGVPATLLRADYVFRAVEVPAGRSTVEMHYAPRSVRLGFAVSALTLLGLGLALWSARSRHS